MSLKIRLCLAALALVSLVACESGPLGSRQPNGPRNPSTRLKKPLPADAPPALRLVIEGAIEQTGQTFYYDPAYVQIDYPGGDLPIERGVCTDVVIRAFRKGGVDLQKEVHEDMKRNFNAYPTKWGLSKTDTNIDHRRVPNLRTFFTRQGKALPVTAKAEDYLPGDVVSWDLAGGVAHIGIVTDLFSPEAGAYLIAHNIGGGARIENVLFSWHITGHYRYF